MTNMELAYRKAEIEREHADTPENSYSLIADFDERELMRDLMKDGMSYRGAFKSVYGRYPGEY